jgi:protein tyrosine/serine phosphatase
MWIAALVVVVLLSGVWAWANFVQTYHLATVQDRVLYRDGMRSIREYNTAINDVHPKLVVSVIDDNEVEKEPFKFEEDYCRRSHIKYARIPVKLGGWPTTEEVNRFLKLTEVEKYQPVLVHCAQGVRRTGMMVAAYQMSVMGYDKEKAKASILTFGHSERSIGDVKRFIDIYDPTTRTVTEAMPMSQE